MAAMRSLFTTLETRRLPFTNPAAPLSRRALPHPPVLPLDDTRRARMLSHLHEPAQRLIILLAGVHALRPSDICALTLDDASPAADTLRIGGRARPLDRLTASHLRAWLTARHQHSPATANPHLLINLSTAGGLKPASRSYVGPPSARPASPPPACEPTGCWPKACATGGDPLALTHPFGISDPTAIGYCAEPDAATLPRPSAGQS